MPTSRTGGVTPLPGVTSPPAVAVLLPCYNEGVAIATVVRNFQTALPGAIVYVFDNNSTDDTAAQARAAGAVVLAVRAQGKGHAVRQAFALIEADIYVMADGDDTYDAGAAPRMVQAVASGEFDMVVATRQSQENLAQENLAQENLAQSNSAWRGGHVLGNRIFNLLVASTFQRGFTDIFSGYRALSRPFVKSFPALAGGFETETEMTVHALQLQLPFMEIPAPYRARMDGSHSKLRTFSDGLRILGFIFRLLRHVRPMFLFSILALIGALVSFVMGAPVLVDYLETGLVPRLPTAVASASLMVIAALSLVAGIVLDSVAHGQHELKRLAYLSVARFTSAPWPLAEPNAYPDTARPANLAVST
jgi:glycosyltransferase involved in cell wall biosynthesis